MLRHKKKHYKLILLNVNELKVANKTLKNNCIQNDIRKYIKKKIYKT